MKIEHFDAALSSHRTEKQPHQERCAKCRYQNNDLHSWKFMPGPVVVQRGRHEFPFSASIPDNCLPSLDMPSLSIAYEFRATACIYKTKSTSSARKTPLFSRFNHAILVQRPYHKPILPQYLSYIVPRDGIIFNTNFDPHVYLLGSNPVSIKVEGLTTFGQHGQDSQVWRLTKSSWSIEESVKARPWTCQAHTTVTEFGEEEKVAKTKPKRLGGREIYEGWKSCDDDGTLEFDFDISFQQGHKIHLHSGYSSPVKSSDDVEVTHSLIVEFIFVLEHFPEAQTSQTIRTGKARIMRLPYRIYLCSNFETEVALLDKYTPPSYSDVVLSPRTYT